MRRKSVDHLVPNEVRTLLAALELHHAGTSPFHGYLLAASLADKAGAEVADADRPSTDQEPDMAYSTVYRCLGRLEERDLLVSSIDPDAPSGGPPRRHFSMTPKGVETAEKLRADQG